MYSPKWLLLLLAIVGAATLAALSYAVPTELTRLESKYPSSAGHHDPLELVPRGENDVPIFVCSWKPFPDSPEKHMYAWCKYATYPSYLTRPLSLLCPPAVGDARKRMIDSTHAEWYVEKREYPLADIGMINLNRGILRFRE